MGNEQQKEVMEMKDYLPITTNNVPSLGTLTLFKNSVNGDMKLNLATTYSIPNKTLAESEVQQMMKVNNNPHICKLVKYSVTKNQMLCLESYSLNLIFEAFPSTLQALIAGKYQFSDEEFWLIAEQILTYLSHLKAIGLHDGDLQPKNVFYAKNSPVKVLNFLLFTTY